jgi:MoaA/NifB/PqqE/SkfB family radical SAM enzyme
MSEAGQYVELGAPLKVYYDITTSCNLNCIFCFKGKTNTDVTWENARSVIKKIADANIPDIMFIGGEPMCCPFIFDALDYAKHLGVNPGIITNGTLFTDDNASKLKSLVNNSISISVHAPNGEVHAEISKEEQVYSRILEGLRILNKHVICPRLLGQKHY